VRLEPRSLPPMIEALAAERVGVVAPAVLDPDGCVSPSIRRAPSLGRATGLGFTGWTALSEYVVEERAYRRTHPVEWALGAVLAIDRTCYQELGGWDETYFLYSEETDFCLRAWDAGWQVMFEPTSRIMHIGGGSGRSDRTHVMQIVNRVRLYRRRHGVAASWLYYALTVASECSWILRGHRTSRASVIALLRPNRRPSELAAPGRVPI
jgi:GT2 family glycosyltransferase